MLQQNIHAGIALALVITLGLGASWTIYSFAQSADNSTLVSAVLHQELLN